jgi:hypothetical protein
MGVVKAGRRKTSKTMTRGLQLSCGGLKSLSALSGRQLEGVTGEDRAEHIPEEPGPPGCRRSLIGRRDD